MQKFPMHIVTIVAAALALAACASTAPAPTGRNTPSLEEQALLRLGLAPTRAIARQQVDDYLDLIEGTHRPGPADVCGRLRPVARAATEAARFAVAEVCDLSALDLRKRSDDVDLRAYRDALRRAARRARLEGDPRTATVIEQRAEKVELILSLNKAQ